MPSVLNPFQFVLTAVAGWMNQHQQMAIDYLREENRVLREQLGDRRLRLNNDQRRRLAAPKDWDGSFWPRSLLWLRPRLCWPGIESSLHINMTAVPRVDPGDRARPERSRLWWSGWQKRTAIGVIGASRVRCP